ncbi:MAG: glycosyltransferase family 4 protein [Lachnospiraceae bacterium]|jgi:phosphatidylinositol alpha-1,6-mannosyltransferase|nr:glycosyltransferase family 4 protein [Lachnospiraceae bacterium]
MQVEQINIFNSDMDPENGGIQNTAYYFVRSFSKRFSVNGYTGRLPSRYKIPNIEIATSYSVLGVLRWLIKKCNNQNTINIAMNCWEAVPALIVNKIRGTKYIVLAHGNDIYSLGNTNGFKQGIYDLINKRIFDNAALITCNSEYTRRLLKFDSYIEKSLVIHPPCLNFGENNLEKKMERFHILSIGRLVERKGFQFVIASMPELLIKYPELEYVIVGEGPYGSQLMDLVKKLSLEEHVRFLGRVSEQEKIEQYEKCSIFIMPSIEIPDDDTVEGFGIVYMEANQFGKYVISGRCGGVPEAVIENVTGTILDSVTKETVKERLERSLEGLDALYTEELIKKRKKWAELHFVDHIAEQYIEAIKTIEG